MGVFVETIRLEDQVSPAAKTAASAASTLTGSIESVQKSLVKANALGDMTAIKKLTTQFVSLTGALGKVDEGLLKEVEAAKAADKASADLVKSNAKAEADKAKASATATATATKNAAELSNTMNTVRDSVSSAVAGMKTAFTSLAAGDVKGAIGGVTDSIAGMSKMLDLVVPGLGQAVSTIIMIAGGIVGLTAGLIQSGMALALQANEAREKMTSLFDALGEGAISGKDTIAMLDKLGDSIGQTRAQLAPLAQSFLTMGITGKQQLEGLTLAAASAGAMAEGGAEKFATFFGQVNAAAETGSKLTIPFKKLEKQLTGVGLNIGDLAKQMGISQEALTAGLKAGTIDAGKFGDALTDAATDKGAGPLASAGAKLSQVWAKATESVMKMFEGIDVGPFLKEVKDLFGILDSGKSSGQALTAGIGAFFKNAFAQATKLVPLVKHFMLDLIIYGLKAYIAIKPIVAAIKDFVTSATGASIISTILTSVWEVLKVIGISILVVVAVAAALWAAMILVSTGVWTAIGAIIGFVTDAGAAFADWVSGAATAAADFVAGLVSGITDGAASVIASVKGLASKATGAFKSALGIASPSKVMAGMGGHMTDGVAQGLDDGASDVHAAATGVAGASVKGMAAGGSSGGSKGGGGGANITVQVLIDGAGKSALEITEEMVAQVFARLALEAGV